MNKQFKKIDKKSFYGVVDELKNIQKTFHKEFDVDDIWTNSKVFEIITANEFNHELIPGHSGSRDAREGNKIFEYKHFKKSSSNHSWTFNDYSDNTFDKLEKTHRVIFAHINDVDYGFPGKLDWYYSVSGKVIADYLRVHTKALKNNRDAINISAKQLEERVFLTKNIPHSLYPVICKRDNKFNNIHTSEQTKSGIYDGHLQMIYDVVKKIEGITHTSNILTSSKFWELFVGVSLNHNVITEQGGVSGDHDGFDEYGYDYEYKIAKTHSWNFQDISEEVLQKYLDNTKSIFLAVADKQNFKIDHIYECSTKDTVDLLKRKLNEKKLRFNQNNKKLKRKQVSISKGDLSKIMLRKDNG